MKARLLLSVLLVGSVEAPGQDVPEIETAHIDFYDVEPNVAARERLYFELPTREPGVAP